IKLAIENHPDIILLDIIMPKSNGLNLLHSLRQDSWGKNVPVIIWSNVSDPQTRKHAEEHGIKTYLIKTDWSLNEAVGKIKEELESHATDKKTSLIKL
ncbi:MAG TPA: response regulator, partial [Candidatus Paceibacterota bacterium]